MPEILMPTPALDEIQIANWFYVKYYTPAQQKECRNLIENHIWVTAKRKQIYVREMTTSHIQNCINCWNGEGKSKIPSSYLGGKNKWLDIFKTELFNRQ